MALALSIRMDADKHGGKACLLDDTFASPLSGSLYAVAGDKVPLNLYWRTVSNGAAARYAVAAASVTFGSDYIPVASFGTVTSAGTGDSEYLTCILDLSTLSEDLIDALAANQEQAVNVDISVAEDAYKRLTFRVPLIVARAAANTSATIATGITITQPGGPGTPFVIAGAGRTQEL